MKKLKNLIISTVLLFGCDFKQANYKEKLDFRNFLRDKHPYCIIKEIELTSAISFKVNDTFNNKVWIYTSNRDHSNLKRICTNCD